MSIQTFLLILLCTMLSTSLCFSQDKMGPAIHPSSRNAKGPLSDSPDAPFSLVRLLLSLENTRLHSEKADIYFRISRYYADRLKIDSALFYSNKIKEESLKANYESGMAKYYLSNAHALFFRRKTDVENLHKAIKIFTRNNELFYLGFAYRILARQQHQSGDFAPSIKSYHNSIHYFTTAIAIRELQHVYYELGSNFNDYFEPDSAAYYLITSLQLAEKLNDPVSIFNSSGNLGEVYLVTDDLDNAVKYLEYALANRTPAISLILVRRLLDSYSDCLVRMNQLDKAEMVMREFERINEKLNDKWGMIMYHKNMGKIDFHKGNDIEAVKFLKLAYRYKSIINSFSFDVKDIAGYLGKTEFRLGQYDSAIFHLTHNFQLAHQVRYGADLLNASMLIAKSYEKKGNKDSAYHYLQLYDHLKDSLMNFRKGKAVIELTARYENQKKEQQIRLLQKEKELNAYQLRSRIDEIEKQNLIDIRKSQQLVLLSQQNEITRLEASEKSLAFENQQKEMIKKQKELELVAKENQLQSAIAGQRKNFAYLAVAAILLFSCYVFYRYSQNKKLSRKLAVSLADLKQAQDQLVKTEKEKERDKTRVDISRDIHDEVGATLSGVALFSEIAREKIQQHKENDAKVYLDQITANSKEMIEKMSDIVWTINPVNDSFERIISKLQSYAVNVCAGKGIRMHFDIDDQIHHYSPSMQVRKNVYMLIKEAINNAVKYSGGKNIFLSLQKMDDQIQVQIRDDGKGFDRLKKHEGNGLNNMKARAAELGADFNIDSNEGEGTYIKLQFKFHPAGGHQELV